MKEGVWAIEDIYPDTAAWEKEYKETESAIDFSEFKGKLGDAEGFYACMQKQEVIVRKIEKLSVYAMMCHDGDTGNSLYDGLLSKATMLSVKYGSSSAFIVPEITALDNAVIEGYIKNPKLNAYDYFLKGVLKDKAHILSEKEEKLLAESGDALGTFHDIFTKIDNADLNLGFIKHNGEKIELSHGAYGVIMHGDDRKLRKKCFDAYYKAYIGMINTISANYYGNVKRDVFYAKARNYPSALSAALNSEDVDESVYKNLIGSVNDNLYLLHRYMAQKKKETGYRDFHMYDVYASTVADAEIKLPFKDAFEMVKKGLSPLGEEYQKLLDKALAERWIDVEERKRKRSGAYSVAVFDTHPYVLLNYQKTTHDVFTIAHELGHAMHSYFSNKTQPYFKADYKIFVAEVASTVNEVLLLKYLLKTAEDKKLRKYLLSYLMEMIRTTLYRQTQFAEFEEFSHGAVERGEPLTKENMCEKYGEINGKYYGDAVVNDEYIKYEWARIPHFYRAFYVYKYATGIISALAIAGRIYKEGESAVKDYFAFLSSGGSDSPVELLKKAGADLTDKKTYDTAFAEFKAALDEYISIEV